MCEAWVFLNEFNYSAANFTVCLWAYVGGGSAKQMPEVGVYQKVLGKKSCYEIPDNVSNHFVQSFAISSGWTTIRQFID